MLDEDWLPISPKNTVLAKLKILNYGGIELKIPFHTRKKYYGRNNLLTINRFGASSELSIVYQVCNWEYTENHPTMCLYICSYILYT